MTLHSMTGFASGQGAEGAYTWVWDIRSVNAKGLDVRIRVPDWLEGLENEIKTCASKKLGRGNVTVGLRLGRAEDCKGQLQINAAAMEAMLAAIAATQAQAAQVGLQLAPVRATDILQMRGVLEQATAENESEHLVKLLLSEFDSLLTDFINMRASEGAALHAVLTEQLSRIEALTHTAAQRAADREVQIKETLQANLARVMSNSDGADADRVAQELALIAVKADVTEELDRLVAHVAAARKLIGQGGLVGRKLDFLMQEFNREANTLCSKAQNATLTE
ncbi:MAG: YicC family protein, partial [Tritonibacter mobilis]|nr:YicC family protein [Tritonibacter mobilis]